MGAKVRKIRGAWVLVVHRGGKRHHQSIGTTDADRKRAQRLADEINARLTLEDFAPNDVRAPIPFCAHVLNWHRLYSPTFKPRYRETSESIIRLHLVPFFGEKDLREIRESDLLEYIALKRTPNERGRVQAPATIKNALTIVRTVLNHAVHEGLVDRNPANGIGKLIRRVARSEDLEARVVDAWTRNEVEKLLGLAREHEPGFEPLLRFLFSTGARRGEALGLQWEDVDFDRSRITIRRALTKGIQVTPKSGKSRVVAMSPTLSEALFDLLGQRRRENIALGRPDIPVHVFCSQAGTPLDERNLTRTWQRLRRRAARLGIRPLRLHAARHTFASIAIASGRSLRFVAEQLGHSDPAFTLKTYAHLLPSESEDMSFADFSATLDGTKRHQTAPADGVENLDLAKYADSLERMVRPARLELATLSSAKRRKGSKKR
jgi:integrase